MYCPFGYDCKNCKRDKNLYVLEDKLGHKFKVRRYKLGNRCKFEVYNEQVLLANSEEFEFINLIGLDSCLYQDFVKGQLSEIKSKRQVTSGNLKRGVF